VPLSWNEIRDRATRFANDWKDAGYERGEAQTFWNEFFGIFGMHRSRVYSFERRVEKLDGGAGYIDCFWPGMMIAEHKSRGKPLGRAHVQALDYLDGLKDREQPRYIVVSDFERIRLYDTEDNSEQEILTAELPKHIKLFGFIAGYQIQVIRPEDPVNIKAAERMGRLHDQLKEAGYEGHDLEVLLVRLLFCMFADDTGIFQPAQAFQEWIELRSNEDGSDLGALLARFFQAVNTPPDRRARNIDEQLNQFPYINGELFAEPIRIADFDRGMREALLEACALDWSGISPAIFGALFQSIMDPEARRNLGAHYTSEANILKLIKPLFLDELRAEFEAVRGNRNRLHEFHNKLRSLTFFDPACGCGNFLVVAYRELRLLELDVLRAARDGQQMALDVHGLIRLDVDQCFGIEIEEFPAQIARVALWLTDHQMNMKVGEEFGQYFARIPLKTSPRVIQGNALNLDWADLVPPDRLSYMLGNPPFIGSKMMTAAQREEMKQVTGNLARHGILDYVSAWYFKAVRYLQGEYGQGDPELAAAMDELFGRISNPSLRVGFVSTNSITQGEQVGVLWQWMLDRGMHIHFAHRTFQWTNEARGKAAVHCVIIGFGPEDRGDKVIYDYLHPKDEPQARAASNINPYLVDAPDVFLPSRRSPLVDAPRMQFGNMPNDGGHLLLSADERDALLTKEPLAKKWIRTFYGASDYINNSPRFCLWLLDIKPNELRQLPLVMSRVEATRSHRMKSTRATTRELAKTPTLFGEIRQPDGPYVLVPRHSSESREYIPVGYLEPEVIVGDSNMFVPDAPIWVFGVLSSAMHMAWVRSVCGRLKSDFRYSAGIVYNNFPWPEDPPAAAVERIEEAAQGVLDARAAFPDASLADLYDPRTMPPALTRAHQQLDRAVDKAYSRKQFKGDADRVAFLFERYAELIQVQPSY
jgi:hypothetical protein